MENDNLQLNHFNAAHREDIIDAGEALANQDPSAFRAVVDRIMASDVVKNISNSINTSSATAKQFFGWIKGIGALGAGVGCLIETAEVAAFFGMATASIYIIGILLLLYAISVLLPSIWARVLNTDTVSMVTGAAS